MELARVFGANRAQLRRGLVCGFWAGHETGTMIGSSWFADHAWDRLRRHAVAYLQIDQPACVGTTGWTTASNAELRRFHGAVETELLGTRTVGWHRATKTGDASFFGLGLPMLTGQGAYTDAELKASAQASLGWWHHSIENTIDKIDWDYMQDHLHVYAAWLWELCTAIVLPFEFASVAAHFSDRLAALAPAGEAVGLAGALARAEALREAALRLDEAAATWRARYAAGETDEAAAYILNTCFKRLSRALVPLASTSNGSYGHDPYGDTPQSVMIPSLYDVPKLATATPEMRWMLETQLIRARNRVADTLNDCRYLIDDTLRQLR